jgi:predicted XRE-type DNA-binding protein
MTEIESFDSVWDAIADTPSEAASLKVRADLMRQIEAIIRAGGSYRRSLKKPLNNPSARPS